MTKNWYWLEGTSYCPECVECDTPAIDAAADGVTRGAGCGWCGCCKRSAIVKTTRIMVTVRYWRGTAQLSGTAYTYRGAMRIAAKNQNLHGPTFYHGDRKLFDDGHGLAYADEAEAGRTVYAV